MSTKETAISVLNQWSDNPQDNAAQIRQYVTKHEWLRADIFKLTAFIGESRLCKVAITDMSIYGIEQSGMVCVAGRANLHIPPNFS
jgi:prefoldin subunit 5